MTDVSGARPLRNRLLVLVGLGVAVIALAGWWSFSGRELSPNDLRQLPQSALEERSRRGPDRYAALCALGERQAAGGAVDEAVASYRTARGLDPANPEALTGFLLHSAGRTAPGWAESVLLEMVQAQPDSGAVELALGRLYELEGYHEPAGPHLRRAVQLDPGNAEAHFQLGKWYGAIGDTGNAAASMREALRLAPKVGRYYLVLADLQIHLGQYAQAARDLADARRLDGDTLLAKYQQARLTLANRPTDQAREQAIVLLREAVQAAPDWPLPRVALGQALLQSGQVQDAIVMLQQTVSGPHPDPKVLASIGRAYYRLRNRKEGDRWIAHYERELAYQRELDAFSDRLRTSPKNVPLRLRRARALLADGATLQALHTYREILNIAPRQSEAVDKIAALVQVPK